MKRTRNEGGAVGPAAKGRHSASKRSPRAQSASEQPRPPLAAVNARTHTLVLTGELNHSSAPALEAEIDRLCDEGVTGITLDLRELTRIDSTGVRVVAFRSRLCKRRGYDFSLIAGSRIIRRALEQAGVSDVVPSLDGGTGARVPVAPDSSQAGRLSEEGSDR